jgi:hypothetical protein
MTAPITRQILNYARAAIIAETGLSESQVYLDMGEDVDDDALPQVILFAQSDDPREDDGENSDGREDRVFSFGASIAVSTGDPSGTDALAVQIRKALLSDRSLGGLVRWTSRGTQTWGRGAGSTPTQMTEQLFKTIFVFEPEEEL